MQFSLRLSINIPHLIDDYDFVFLGIDFKQKLINLDGVPIKLQIWDVSWILKSEIVNYETMIFHLQTAGQERFRTLTTAYYRGAMGILLMYDVTSLESFNNLSYWLRNIQEVRRLRHFETKPNFPFFTERFTRRG